MPFFRVTFHGQLDALKSWLTASTAFRRRLRILKVETLAERPPVEPESEPRPADQPALAGPEQQPQAPGTDLHAALEAAALDAQVAAARLLVLLARRPAALPAVMGARLLLALVRIGEELGAAADVVEGL